MTSPTLHYKPRRTSNYIWYYICFAQWCFNNHCKGNNVESPSDWLDTHFFCRFLMAYSGWWWLMAAVLNAKPSQFFSSYRPLHCVERCACLELCTNTPLTYSVQFRWYFVYAYSIQL